MRTYSIADASKYYRQNNNIIKPTIRCKPTETVEVLDLAGWDVSKLIVTEKDGVKNIPPGGYKQPEDNLTAYMESVMGKDSPEDWKSIVLAINEHFYPKEEPIERLSWNWDLREVLFGIVQKKPFSMSSLLTDAGHIVGVVGFTTKADKIPTSFQEINLGEVTEICIDDPYGRKVNGKYDTSLSGFNVPFTLEEFKRIWRGIGIQVKRKV